MNRLGAAATNKARRQRRPGFRPTYAAGPAGPNIRPLLQDTNQGLPLEWHRKCPRAGEDRRKPKEKGDCAFGQGFRIAERAATRRWESARTEDGSVRQTAARTCARFRPATRAEGGPSKPAKAAKRRLRS